MGKEQELLQAVKTEDLVTVQRLLQRPKQGKASEYHTHRFFKCPLTHHGLHITPYSHAYGLDLHGCGLDRLETLWWLRGRSGLFNDLVMFKPHK